MIFLQKAHQKAHQRAASEASSEAHPRVASEGSSPETVPEESSSACAHDACQLVSIALTARDCALSAPTCSRSAEINEAFASLANGVCVKKIEAIECLARRAAEKGNKARGVVIVAFLDCLGDGSSLVRSAAAKALKKLIEKDDVDEVEIVSGMALSKTSKWKSESIEAIEVLAHLAEKGNKDVVIAALLDRIGDESRGVRVAAAEALNKLVEKDDVDWVEIVSGMVSSKTSKWKSIEAIEVLAHLAKKGNKVKDVVIAAFLNCLGDETALLVQNAAAKALGVLAGEDDAAVIAAGMAPRMTSNPIRIQMSALADLEPRFPHPPSMIRLLPLGPEGSRTSSPRVTESPGSARREG